MAWHWHPTVYKRKSADPLSPPTKTAVASHVTLPVATPIIKSCVNITRAWEGA